MAGDLGGAWQSCGGFDTRIQAVGRGEVLDHPVKQRSASSCLAHRLPKLPPGVLGPSGFQKQNIIWGVTSSSSSVGSQNGKDQPPRAGGCAEPGLCQERDLAVVYEREVKVSNENGSFGLD